MDYLGWVYVIYFLCVTKFAFVEVIKGCIMEISINKQKDFTADELQELFLSVHWESGNYPEKLVRAMHNSTRVISAWDGDKLVGLVRALMMEKQSHFCIILWWTLLIRDSTLEMS
ncbi:MAG: hypothetical protein ACLU9R_00180 [Faecalibacterium sp.]